MYMHKYLLEVHQLSRKYYFQLESLRYDNRSYIESISGSFEFVFYGHEMLFTLQVLQSQVSVSRWVVEVWDKQEIYMKY